MQRTRLSLALAVTGVAVAFAAAPLADGNREAVQACREDNPLLPGCETTGGSATLGGQTEDCASPGNSQITATPEFIPGNMYGGFYGFPGFF